ncbi:MAG: hypothetical protein N3A54_03925 [Patescibacteria group bacterium]|nr:hypothetical protein [Patescibacteria group bacterium]
MSTLYLQNVYDGRVAYELEVGSFVDSMLYKDSDPNFIDLWKVRNYYGRVNVTGDTIVLKESLKNDFVYNDGKFFGIDFVLDNLVDMINYYNKGAMKYGWPLIKVEDVLFSNRHALDYYRDYLEGIRVAFDREHKDKKYYKFLSLEDYISLFLEGRSVMRFSSFLLSSLNPMTTSGLVFNIFPLVADTKEAKVDKFLKKDWYRYFVESARRFGFLVDKNVPWRVAIDVGGYSFSYYYHRRRELRELKDGGGSNVEMRNFLEKYGDFSLDYIKKVNKVTLEGFFDEYYEKSQKFDIREMERFFVNNYIGSGFTCLRGDMEENVKKILEENNEGFV